MPRESPSSHSGDGLPHIGTVHIFDRNHAYAEAIQILGIDAHDSNVLVHVWKEHLGVEHEKSGRDTEHQECLQDIVSLCDHDPNL